MPSMSSGEVSILTRMTRLPASAACLAVFAVKYTRPAAAPGEAGSAEPMIVPFFKATGSKVGCRSWSSAFASRRKIASSSVIIFSSTISQAIFSAAGAVLLPALVWRK